jgi:UDP-N-acetylglucosamine:LPS N-acetylglucosamine transferase
VIEQLVDSGCEVHVLTSGNGLAYFKDQNGIKSLTSMESFFYSGKNSGVSGWSTFKSIFSLAAIAKTKKVQLSRLLDQIHPDVAVIDSEYAIAPLRQRKIPVVALNTSEMIVTEYLKRWRESPETRSHFWFIEFSDYLFHKYFCDLILSPFPIATRTRHRKFQRIGLIARRQIMEKSGPTPSWSFPSPRQLRRVVFMLSGSVHASNICFEQHKIPFQIDVVGRTGESRGNVTYHGRQMNNIELLASADALVINGGYSAVSEAFVLGKPVFVVPVPGHAEQFVNACLVRDLGLGFVATETNVLNQLLSMYQQDCWTNLKTSPGSIQTHGAQEAAQAILSMTNRTSVQRKIGPKIRAASQTNYLPMLL